MKETTFRGVQLGIPKSPEDFIDTPTDVMTPTYNLELESQQREADLIKSKAVKDQFVKP